MLAKSIRFVEWVSEWSGRIVSFLIYGILGTLIFEIFSRYLFNTPTIWAHEAGSFFFGTYFILGAAYCLLHGGMINVDVICTKLSRRTQAVLNVITFIFFLAVCLTLLIAGGQDAVYSWQVREHSNTTWAPPLYPLRTVIPVGAALLLLEGLAQFIREAAIAFTGREIEEKKND